MIAPRTTAAVALVAALLLAGAATGATDEDLLPKGPAKAVILRVCTNCHGTFDIVHAFGKTTDQWRTTVVRMETHGAELTLDQAETIAVYLGKNFPPGPQSTQPPAAPAAPAAPPAVTPEATPPAAIQPPA